MAPPAQLPCVCQVLVLGDIQVSLLFEIVYSTKNKTLRIKLNLVPEPYV